MIFPFAREKIHCGETVFDRLTPFPLARRKISLAENSHIGGIFFTIFTIDVEK